MKVSPGGSNVIASAGIQSEARFKILDNAHAFRILSSGLYSDKIGAVLREIGCNAADAHTAAGHGELPFEVKLPTALDPQFYIKDWGTGLTHDEVTGLFTTYFSSNKSDSNELTGAFGLGSKSPFSYTDSFTVTAVREGVQRVYTAHLGADGSPVISLLSTSDADEDWRNGMMVSFPVLERDVTEFRSKAQKIYGWFAVPPTLLGADRPKRPVFLLEGSNFAFPLEGHLATERVPRVLMGNVAYPISLERLGMADLALRALLAGNVHVWVPIGTVMPTAAREELEYDDTTRENLTKVLQAVADELAETLRAHALEPAPSEWERHVRTQKYRDRLPKSLSNSVSILLDRLGVTPEDLGYIKSMYETRAVALPGWVGQEPLLPRPVLVSSPDESADSPQSSLALPLPAKDDRAPNAQVFHVQQTATRRTTKIVRKQVRYGKVASGSSLQACQLQYAEAVQIVYADTTHAWPRVKARLESEGGSKVILLVLAQGRDAKTLARTQAQALGEALGGVEVVGSSALPEPMILRLRREKPKDVKAHFEQVHGKTEVKYFDLTAHVSFTGSGPELTLADVPPEGRYYVVSMTTGRRRAKTRYVCDIAGHGRRLLDYYDAQEMLATYRVLRERGIPVPPIDGLVVLAAGDVRRLKLHENGWKSAFVAVAEAIRDKAVQKALVKKMGRMPLLDLDHSYQCRSAGIVGAFACLKKKKESAWQAIGPVIAEFPVLSTLVDQLVEVNDTRIANGGFRPLLRTLLKHLPSLGLGSVFREPLTTQELRELTTEAYPGTAFIDIEGIAHACERKRAEEACRVLRQFLFTREQMMAGSPRAIVELEALAG